MPELIPYPHYLNKAQPIRIKTTIAIPPLHDLHYLGGMNGPHGHIPGQVKVLK